MQLGLGKTLFPSWSAALTLVANHGVDAAGHTQAAIKADSGSERLDHAVRAVTSFDHAVDNTQKLPVDWIVPGASTYLRGYAAAKAAVDLLVGTGVIPGARERVGLQNLLAARDAFVQGVNVSRADASRFGRKLAGGWLEATAEDAVNGVRMLEPAAGRALLQGIGLVQQMVRSGKQIDQGIVRQVNDAFASASSQLSAAIEQAAATGGNVAVDRGAWDQSTALLRQALEA